MTSPGRLGNNPEFQALRAQVAMLTRRLGIQQTQTNVIVADGQVPLKRFRVAVYVTPGIISLGGTMTATITWSTPMPSATYNVDVACSAALGGVQAVITNQTAAGCTVSFTAPNAIALGSTCVVIGIAPAASAPAT